MEFIFLQSQLGQFVILIVNIVTTQTKNPFIRMRKIFVYIRPLRGSNLHVIGLVLEQYGLSFEPDMSKILSSVPDIGDAYAKPRYEIFTGETTKPSVHRNILNLFGLQDKNHNVLLLERIRLIEQDTRAIIHLVPL